MTTAYYSSRRAAIAGARRVLEKEGVTDPLVQVHFSIVEQVEGESWTWERIDNTPAIKAEKPATPQVDALPGMTPLGVTPDKGKGVRAAPRATLDANTRQRQAAAAAQAIDAAPPVPTPAVRPPAERWRKAKRVEPGRVAYRPRAGSTQAEIYALLTQAGGITVEAFCQAMIDSKSKDKMFHKPSSVWSGLVYLFVTLKGYGLSFDGARLKLLAPADERDAVRAGA